MELYGRDLITTQDWSVDELIRTIELAEKFKDIIRREKRPPKILERKNFFMIFYAPSTRTRGAFEAGMELLGGHAPYIDVTTTRVRAGEAVKDVAKMYDIYGDGIGVRILDYSIDFIYGEGRRVIEQFAEAAKVPVINLACCTYHPTQGIGDIMTVKNKLGGLEGKKYVIMWAYSNRLRGRCSIQAEALIATRFGMDVVLAHPPGFDIDPKIVEAAKTNAKESGGSFEISHDFKEALKGANVVFPRSWVTPGLLKIGVTAFGADKEVEIHNKYRDWRLGQEHVDDLMDKPAIVTHVLPVFRGEEATDEVMDGPNSVIYEQAENNFYAKMAVLSLTMAKEVRL
ncbi:MAG: ornithine carbamoyltransferase [Candidatus Bathyarchaeia archaeon]